MRSGVFLPLLWLFITSPCWSDSRTNPYPQSWDDVRQEFVGTTLERTWVTMRDGVRLDTNIYLPSSGEPPYPTVLVRSPYPVEPIFNLHSKTGVLPMFLENGYAVVFQNERGLYWSEGDYDYLSNAAEDGYDTVDWLARQEWSNGKVGTFGCSSSAENQLALSVADHPAHVAAIAQAPGAGIGRVGPYAEQGNIYRGGALQLLFAYWNHNYILTGREGARLRPRFASDLSREERIRAANMFSLRGRWGWNGPKEDLEVHDYIRHLPVAELSKKYQGPQTPWEDFARMTPGDAAWADIPFVNEGDDLSVPMLWVFSWYDVAVAPNVAMFNEALSGTAGDSQFMVVSPIEHCRFGLEEQATRVGDRVLGDARFDYRSLYLSWFDYWLKGKQNDVMARPRVEYYQMGRNQWLSADAFPTAAQQNVSFYLESGEGANSLYGDGALNREGPGSREDSDGYVYDPLRPVPSLGGGICCLGDAMEAGSFDQSEIEIRNDVLVYTSAVLEEDMNVAGFVEVELYVSSDARDTDFTLKLVDVDGDGRAYNIDDTILRARYREGYEQALMMEPGNVARLVFPPMITANTFRKGHRIRLEVSSSNFPRYDRNLNTGGNNFDESKPVVARNRVHHSTTYPSVLRLPVVQP